MLTSDSPPLDYATIEAARIPWRQVAAAIADLMAVVDAAGHTVFFNEPLAQALARPVRPDLSLDEQPLAYGLYRADGTLYPAAELPLARALLGGEIVTDVEIILRKPDGGRLITRWNAAPLRDDAGEIVGAVGTGRDVTAQTHAREWLQASERRALLLAELGSHFAASLDLREVLQRVARSVGEGLADWCTIDLLRADAAPVLRTAAIYHRDPARVAALRRLRQHEPMPAGAGLAGQVLATGEPLWIHELTPDLLQTLAGPAETAMAALMGATTWLMLPLPGQRGVLGVLTLALAAGSPQPRFSEDDYALVQEVASRAALAIENAQLYQHTRRQVARLAALRDVALALSGSLILAESGPPALAALLPASRTDMGALYVLDPANRELTCVVQVGFPADLPPPATMRLDEPSLAPQVVRTGRARYRGDGAPVPADSQLRLAAFGALSFVSLPVVGQGRVIGCLLLLARAPRRFGPADLSFLESAANQIGLSIENGRLYQHTRELLDEVKGSEQIKDEFISIASHELRTPLTAVRGYAEMALRRTRSHPDREADIKALEMIQLQVDRMNRLITDLLDVSHMTSDQLELRPQRLDLVALVWHVVDQQQPLAPQHPLLVEVAPAMIVGAWDAGRLEQVLLNLLNNAVKYSPQGGPVEILVTGDAGAGWVSIAIRDHGIGVPPASLPHLFTRFYRAPNARQGRGGGLGIGLYVSHQLVRAHGGDLTVANVPGGGAIFTVRLPWRPPQPGATPA